MSVAEPLYYCEAEVWCHNEAVGIDLEQTLYCASHRRCGHQLRDGLCKLSPDHRGRHTTVAFGCDSCDKIRRGSGRDNHRVIIGSDGDVADTLQICFLCQRGIQ